MWFVYILKSTSKNFTYIGSTNSLGRRLSEHNRYLVQSTKAYVPYKIISYVAVETKKQATELEQYFKTRSGKAVLNKRILGLNPLVDEA